MPSYTVLDFVHNAAWLSAEDLYQSTFHVTGRPTGEIRLKRGKLLVTPKDINAVLSPFSTCCSSKECIQKWQEDLTPEVARAIVTTERNAYAEMGETARRVHYMTWLSHLRVPQYVTMTGGKNVLQGEHTYGYPNHVGALSLQLLQC
jgi:hypothetical protein